VTDRLKAYFHLFELLYFIDHCSMTRITKLLLVGSISFFFLLIGLIKINKDIRHIRD